MVGMLGVAFLGRAAFFGLGRGLVRRLGRGHGGGQGDGKGERCGEKGDSSKFHHVMPA
jgi:hypothetical protein